VKSKKKRISMETRILILLLLMCVAPMAVNPSMIGIHATHIDQAEHLAESFVEGHIDLQYDYWDAKLFQLDNVYDYDERAEKEVFHQWDHAFYDSHYYMYFGVVPALVVLLPFRMLTGVRLPTFLATALFSSLFIIGMFRLFRLIKKQLFPELPERIRLLLATAFSLAGMWYAMDAPTIYCLAITSALCMEIWSMYFYVKAVWTADGQADSIRMAFLGALFGALAFGCRPTIALANLLAIPMFVVYLKKQKLSLRFWVRMLYVISPYVVVGAALMYYNYIRFGTPFEFGQAYQLTIADQTAYGNMADNISWSLVIGSLKENYFTVAPLSCNFPYVQFGGAFVNFPVFALSIVGLFVPGARRALREKKLLALTICLVSMPVIITVMDALWVPWLTERYRMDFYWLMGIATFLVCSAWYSSLKERGQRIFGWVLSALGVYTMLACVVLYAIPYEDNLTAKSPLWMIILIMVSMTAWLLNICRLTGKADKVC
jgi:hypothetical protein